MVVLKLRTSLITNIADVIEIYGVWVMVEVHWTVWNGWFISSCCSGCGVCLPSFPVSPIYILISPMMSSYPFGMIGSWSHVAMVVVLVCPHFSSLRYIYSVSLMMSSYPVFVDDVLYVLLLYWYRFALNIFPVENGGSSWNFWELAIGERGQLEVQDEKESMPLVIRVAIVAEVYGAVCQLYLRL